MGFFVSSFRLTQNDILTVGISPFHFVSVEMTILQPCHLDRSGEISYNYPYGRDFSIALIMFVPLEMTIVFIRSGCLHFGLREGDMTILNPCVITHRKNTVLTRTIIYVNIFIIINFPQSQMEGVVCAKSISMVF